jgi:hypothetical protein
LAGGGGGAKFNILGKFGPNFFYFFKWIFDLKKNKFLMVLS